MQGCFTMQVKYTIVYKNPGGIISVGVHFTLRNITEKDLPLSQSSEVTYLQPPHKVSRCYDKQTDIWLVGGIGLAAF